MKKQTFRIIWGIVIISLGILFMKVVPTFTAAGQNNQNLAKLQATNMQVKTGSNFIPTPMFKQPINTMFGIEMPWGINNPGGLEEMVQAGSSWVRRNNIILWSDIEATPGQRNWPSGFEGELVNAYEHNMQVILVIRSTPTWAQKFPGYYCGPIAESKLTAWSTFLHDVVERYSAAPYYIKYYEIWNEPDVDQSTAVPDEVYGCWGDVDDPYYGGEYYGQMLNIVYPSIKAANPNAQVLIGGLVLDCNPNPPVNCTNPAMKFLDGVLRVGAGNSFDIASFHSYDYTAGNPGNLGRYGNSNWLAYWNGLGPVVGPKAEYLRSVLAEYGFTNKPLMDTESGMLTWDGDICDATCEQTKAYYVAEVYATAINSNLIVNNWFAVFGWRNSGLLEYPDRTPLPAYAAYKFARYEFSTSVPLPSSVEYPNVKKYEFDRGDMKIWIMWSMDGLSHKVMLPGTPSAVWDVYGNPVSYNKSLTVTLMPVYVEWKQ